MYFLYMLCALHWRHINRCLCTVQTNAKAKMIVDVKWRSSVKAVGSRRRHWQKQQQEVVYLEWPWRRFSSNPRGFVTWPEEAPQRPVDKVIKANFAL